MMCSKVQETNECLDQNKPLCKLFFSQIGHLYPGVVDPEMAVVGGKTLKQKCAIFVATISLCHDGPWGF